MRESKAQKLANEYVAWATEQFNRDRKMISGSFRLAQFVTERHISRKMHSQMFWILVNGSDAL